ncbi:hypothetical protein, partial [Cylindrospermopsis raciborskii]|uniref:hypothetical protein n=1 Tax=Cylindrospermopsis raciborskii TaxID=77022 RepID=UPI0022C77340
MNTYQICTKTVMDTSDPGITFDQDGISNHYWNFQKVVKPNWYNNSQGLARLEQTVETIKNTAKG